MSIRNRLWGNKTVPLEPLKNELYTKVGRNTKFEVEPAIIHFAGFKRNVDCVRFIKIRNISISPARMHIVLPDEDEFTVELEGGEKRGQLAPGIAETVRLNFRSDQLVYHYGEVRIHTMGNNILVPMHAYPSCDPCKDFPRTINFPRTEVGQKRSRNVPLSSTLPINFSYRLEPLYSTPDYTIISPKGIIPKNSRIEVQIVYHPTRRNTSIWKVRVHVSQINFEPFICTITGNARPMVKPLPESKVAAICYIEQLAHVFQPKTTKRKEPVVPLEQIVDGYKIPTSFNSVKDVTCVLNQDPKKEKQHQLRIKQRERRLRGENMRKSMIIASDPDHVSSANLNPNFECAENVAMKRMMFEVEMKDFRKREIRIKNLASMQRIGQVLPSKKEIERIKSECQNIKTHAARHRSDWMSIPQKVQFKPSFNMYKAGDLDKRSNVLKKLVSAATLTMREIERKRPVARVTATQPYAISPPKSVIEKTKVSSRTEKKLSNINIKQIAGEISDESPEEKKRVSIQQGDQAVMSGDVTSRSITPRLAKKKFVRYVIPKNPFSREALPKPPAHMTAPPFRPKPDFSSTPAPALPDSNAS